MDTQAMTSGSATPSNIQAQRDAIRGDELSHLQDVVERNVNRSTGT